METKRETKGKTKPTMWMVPHLETNHIISCSKHGLLVEDQEWVCFVSGLCPSSCRVLSHVSRRNVTGGFWKTVFLHLLVGSILVGGRLHFLRFEDMNPIIRRGRFLLVCRANPPMYLFHSCRREAKSQHPFDTRPSLMLASIPPPQVSTHVS